MAFMTRDRGPLPPVILLLSILLQFALYRYLPVATVLPAPWNWLGAAPILIGIALVAVPAVDFGRRKTTIIPFKESSTLIRSGFYRFTRNPMYVGMLLILVGIALLMGSVSPFLAPILFVPILNSRVIRHEERMLAEVFGDEYRKFKKEVRRWL